MGSSPPPILLSSLLGISGASFIYVSTSDLLPELHRERKLSHLIFLIFGFLFILFLSKVFPAD
jgi:zinc transporter ZupT